MHRHSLTRNGNRTGERSARSASTMWRAAVCIVFWLSANPAFAADKAPVMVTPGAFSVSATGALTYSIPIAVPPGTAGMVPSLSLDYNSQSGNGLVGVGWTLSGLPAITRCARTVAQDGNYDPVNNRHPVSAHGGVDYDGNDVACLDGQRLKVINGGTYWNDGSEYRTEIDGFSRVIYHASGSYGPWFEVHTKAGQTMQFGNSPDSQVVALCSSPSVTRLWAVNQISDTVQNYLTVTYGNDTACSGNGQYWPARIDYTGNAARGLTPYNSVQFQYEPRSDFTPRYEAGSAQSTTWRLNYIYTYASISGTPTLTSKYALTYQGGSGPNDHSLLHAVQMFDGSGNPLPATTFSWQNGGGMPTHSSGTAVASIGWANSNVAEWNGDGLNDAFDSNVEWQPGNGGPGTAAFNSWKQNPDQTFSTSTQNLNLGSCYCIANDTYEFFPGFRFALDLTGKGISSFAMGDTITYYDLNDNAYNDDAGYLYQNDGTGNLSYWAYGFPNAYNPQVGDLDGDGRADFWLHFSIGNMPRSGGNLSNGDGSFDGDPTYTPTLIGGNVATYLADFNGDGCTDILTQSSSEHNIHFECSHATNTVAVPDWLGQGFQLIIGDFNGDGKADVLTASPSGGSLNLSTGKGLIAVGDPSSWGFPAGWGNSNTYEIVTGDWNGDGKTDIAFISHNSSSPHQFFLATGTGFALAFTISNSTGDTYANVGDWNSDGVSDIEIGNGTSDTIYYMTYAPEVLTEIDNGIGVQTYVAYNRINAGGSFYTQETSATYPTRDLDGQFYVVSEVDSANGLGTCTGLGGTYCYKSTYAYTGAKSDLQGRGFLGFHTVSITDAQTGIVQTTVYHQDFPYIGLIASQTKSYGSTVLSSTTNNYCYSSASTPCLDDTGYPATTRANTYFVFLQTSTKSGTDLDGTILPAETTTYGHGPNTGYDAYGNVVEIIVQTELSSEWSWKDTNNSYNAPDTTNWILGRLASATTVAKSSEDPNGITRSSSFQYFANGLLSQEVVEPNDTGSMRLETDYKYDGFGNKTQVQVSGFGGSRTTITTWESGKGRFAMGDTNALGQSESWSFDERFGLPTQQQGPNGILTEWSYDGFGRRTSETRFANLADTNNTELTYNFCVPGGCPGGIAFYATSTPMRAGAQNGPEAIAYYDMLSRAVIMDVQEFNNQSSVCWARTYTVYDGNGRVSQVSQPYFFNYPSGCPTDTIKAATNTYDTLGRAVIVSKPNGGTITTGFHGLSTSVTVTVDGNPGDNQTTTTVKNVLGQTKSITDTSNNTTTYNYDAYGDLLAVTDPAGNVSLYYYDTRGRKIFACEPDRVQYVVSVCDGGAGLNDKWSYGYDAFGDVTEQIDANGNTTNLGYDQLGRLTVRIEPGLVSTWAYGTSAANHNVGKLVQTKACTSSSACTGSDWRAERDYTYDDHGRQTRIDLTVSGAGEGSFTTAYNTDQGISSVTYPSGFTAQYTYTQYGFTTGLYDGSGNVLWQALTRDAHQHITSEQAQNPSNGSVAIATTRTFDPNTGLVTSITANGAPGSAAALTWTPAASPCTADCWGGAIWGTGAAALANLSYSYDLLGKMTERADSASNNTQYFCYDNLNRITGYNSPDSSCTNQTLTVTMFYDALGNVTEKSDVCGSSNCYVYPSAGQPKPHAVSSLAGVENGVTNPTYTYDNNGNMLTGAGRTMAYTAFNMVAQMMQGTSNLCWGYDADHQRTRMDVAPDCSGSAPASTNYYLHDALSGLMEDKVASGGNTSFTDYLIVGGAIIGTRTQVNSNTPTTTFYVLDSQGSVAVTTSQDGALLCRITYTAFGESTASGSSCAAPSREYLSQESINDGALYNLINLNARIFDPVLVRFMGADPVINPYEPQDLNPYSYGLNSPLWLPDPSGMCFLGCFWNQSWFRPLVSIAVAAVGAYFMPAFLASEFPGTFAVAATGEAAAATAPNAAAFLATGAISGGASGAIATGTLKGALIGTFEGAAFAEIGGLHLDLTNPAELAESAALHGLVGGLASALGGGNFGSGFLAAGFSGLAAPNPDSVGIIGGTAISSVSGGAASVLGGGKFANGAETGAFGYLFNKLLHVQLPDGRVVTEGVNDAISPLDFIGGAGSLIYRGVGELASLFVTEESFDAIGSTGVIGERWLAENIGGEIGAFFRTTLGARFVDTLADDIAYESKVGYQALTDEIEAQIAKDVELRQTGAVNSVEWHFFRSPVTGLMGPNGPLLKALQNANIRIITH